MPTTHYVHTIGDSTLDNIYWMFNEDGSNVSQAKASCVEGQLQCRLASAVAGSDEEYLVKSHAYDGFTTRSVLHGDYIGDVLPNDARKVTYLNEKAAGARRYVDPLRRLKESIDQDPEAIHHVVLSAGGNDFRVKLHKPWKLLRELKLVQERYIRIVDKIKSMGHGNVRPILMFQYRPDANNDCYHVYKVFGIIGRIAAAVHLVALATLATAAVLLAVGSIGWIAAAAIGLAGAALLALSTSHIPLKTTFQQLKGQKPGVAVINALMEKFYQPMLKKAQRERIPVLDLPNTFNPFKNLFRSGIEPGVLGAELISEGLEHVIRNHDYNGESRLYSRRDSDSAYRSKPNRAPAFWNVAYPSTPTSSAQPTGQLAEAH